MEVPTPADNYIFQTKSTLPKLQNTLGSGSGPSNQEELARPQQQPWKPVYSSVKDSWVVTSSKIQKALCLAVFGITLVSHATTLHQTGSYYYINWSKASASNYLKLARVGLTCVKFLWFSWTMWKSSAELSTILNDKKGNGGALSSFRRVRKCLCIIYIILVHLYFIQRGILALIWVGNINPTFFLDNAGFAHILTGAEKRWMIKLQTDLWNTGNIGWFLAELILSFAYRFHHALQDLFFMCTLALAFWGSTTGLEASLRSIERETRCGRSVESVPVVKDVVIEEYGKMKDLSGAVNRSWSTPMLLWMMEAAMRIVFYLNVAVQKWHWVMTGGLMLGMCCKMISLILFAQVPRTMARFKIRLIQIKNAQLFSEDKILWELTLKEVETGRVGMGADGMFKIDYGFLAQFSGLCITLFGVGFESKE